MKPMKPMMTHTKAVVRRALDIPFGLMAPTIKGWAVYLVNEDGSEDRFVFAKTKKAVVAEAASYGVKVS